MPRRRPTLRPVHVPYAVAYTLADNRIEGFQVIFRQEPRFDTPWQVSLIVVLGLIALSVSVLERRVRGVEIVT